MDYNYKKRFWLCCCFFILLGIWVPATSAQEPTLTQYSSNAHYTFGQQITVSLEAKSAVAIQEAVLFFAVPGVDHTLTVSFPLEPTTDVQITEQIAPNQINLAPFAPLTYWWVLRDVSGATYTIPDQRLFYDDDRFIWQHVSREGVDVFWTGDNVEMGQVILDLVQESVPHITAVIPLEQINPIRIYVYPTSAELNSALRLSRYEKAGAHAFPELGVILITASNVRTASVDLVQGEQSIPHELSHLLLYQAVGVGYDALPLWFDEGLATYFEDPPNVIYEEKVLQAVANGTPLNFAALCERFPPRDDPDFLLAYGQSTSLINYIQQRYGNNMLRQMVLSFADGADCHSVVERVLGMSLRELENRWYDTYQPRLPIVNYLQKNGAWLLLVMISFAFMGLLAAGSGLRGRKNE